MTETRYRSIELKLPLAVSGLLILVIAAVSTVAYVEVRRATITVASERHIRVTQQIADLFEAAATQTKARLERQASHEAIVRFLGASGERTRAEALEALQYTGSQANQLLATELRDASGAVVLSTAADPTPDAASLTADLDGARNGIAVREFRFHGDSIVYPLIVPVPSESESGYLIEWLYATSSPESRGGLSRLIGSATTLYMGNQGGDVWTDFNGAADPPPFDASDSARAYERDGVGMQLGRVAAIPGTQWAVLLEFAQEDVLTPVGLFLRRILAAVFVVTLVGLFAAWRLSRRLSRPLRALASAAKAVSGGDYTHRLEFTSRDEIGMVAVAFNRMSERVQGAQQRMEGRVRERTRELDGTLTQLREQEQRLYEAKEAAERANHSKSDFLAKMSHELRTPLNSIIGFSEVLQDRVFGELNEKQGQYVDHVLTSGRQLLDLINDILDLSKVEVGRMDLHLENVSVEPNLAHVMAIVQTLAAQKNIELHLDVESDLRRVHVDASKLKQIMYNLVGNAIKFTPDGGRIDVSATRTSTTNGKEEMIQIAVADTGIGISGEDIGRVFDEFEQVDNTYAREQPGTGLGLALTRRLVELHGGQISLESEVGCGCTFRFTLPTEREDAGAPALPEPTDEIVIGESAPLVLIVDDDRVAADLLTHYLTHAGYRVQHAVNGDEALALARDRQPDVITLDILMPGLDGHEVLSQLKKCPETQDIPVVVVSVTEDRAIGMSLGAADWFVKPARRKEFVCAIQRAVGLGTNPRDKTVLVVDDEPKTVEYLTDIITHQGFRVITTTHGREGIDLALEQKPDVVVLDLLMPDVSGFDVVREIRSHPAGRDMPIVVFSTKELTPEERDELRPRVQAIVSKGSGRDNLLEELALVSMHGRKPAAASAEVIG